MEQEILKLFLYKEKIKFNEIVKGLKARSNKVSYHLKNLLEKQVLAKEKDFYKLAKENLIPYLSKKDHALPVVLIHLGDQEKCFLYERKKRPFRNKLALPGGRMISGENLEKTTERILKEKFRIKGKFERLCSVAVEHIKNKEGVFQTDVVFFVKAKTKDKIDLTQISKNKSKIITSDYKMVMDDLDKETKINNFSTNS